MRTINKTNATQVQYQIKPLWIRSNNHKEKIIFDVIKTQRDIYLDILWLTKWNSKIEWTSMRIEIKSHLFNIFKRLTELKKNLNFLTRKWKIKKELIVTNEVSQLLKKFQKVLKKSKKKITFVDSYSRRSRDHFNEFERVENWINIWIEWRRIDNIKKIHRSQLD